MKKNKAIYAGVAALAIAVGVFAGVRKHEPAAAGEAATAQLFAQTLKDAAGTPQNLAQFQGKPLVVNFWATWCAPCVQEMPELSALQTELAASKVQIIGIGIDSPSNIAEFAAKYKISYPLLVAGMEGSDLSRKLGNQAGGLPFTVLIGADGHVRKAYLGRLKMNELRADLGRL
ncbi:TlpA family protein disulfide reductase [Oxalobacteraceae bacterium OM1]|nr:TlpA family protein disulfide reductase [Oxalobacteraceae bacterium OM1]